MRSMKVEAAGRSLVVFCPLGAPAGTKFKMAVPAELLKSVRAKIDARRTAARRDAEARADELRREATRVAAAAAERERAARLLAAATGEGGAIPDDVNFVAVPQFCGRRDGFVYKAGARGVGYYREGASEAAGDATAPPVGVSAHGRGDYSSRGFHSLLVGPQPELAGPDWFETVKQNEKLALESSPASVISQLKAPLLLIHGDADSEVAFSE